MRTILLFCLLCIVSIGCNALLRPRRARRSSNKHYNKNVIKNHIRVQPKRAKVRVHEHAHSDSTDDDDITTATSEMWASCEKRYFEQNLDHFGNGIGVGDVTGFQQRYYLCGKDLFDWTPNNPVFVYFGNEADVTAYIDYTGLMWQQAPNFNALLVFMEHRYYGESLPYTQSEIIESTEKLKYLTTSQALHDYSVLLDYLQKNTFGYAEDFDSVTSAKSPIIGFGGSYGGMLAAWFRMKYPQYLDGAISGSAPIWGVFGLIPAADPYAFAAMETYDASTEGGVDNDLCKSNLQTGWDDIMEFASTAAGRQRLADIFNLCSTPESKEEASVVLDIVEEAVSYMAMSSYPYASNYISGAVMGTTTGSLPAYPVAYACNEYLAESFDSSLERVEAIGSFNAVFWNSDGSNTCIDTETLWNTYNDYIWDYLYCRSLLIPSGSLGGDHDMLWQSEWNAQGTISWCNEEYNIEVDAQGPASRLFGGRAIYKAMSNIVFSNGNMDPWMPGGVNEEVSDSLVNILIEGAGHHLDLMFSNSADPDSVVQAREIEVENIEKWIAQADSAWSMGMCDVKNEPIELQSHPWISALNMLL